MVLGAFVAFGVFAEVQVIDGKKYECRDGLCYLVEEGGLKSATPMAKDPRIAQGYMRAEEFVAFLEGNEVDSLAGHGLWVMLLLVFFVQYSSSFNVVVLNCWWRYRRSNEWSNWFFGRNAFGDSFRCFI